MVGWNIVNLERCRQIADICIVKKSVPLHLYRKLEFKMEDEAINRVMNDKITFISFIISAVDKCDIARKRLANERT